MPVSLSDFVNAFTFLRRWRRGDEEALEQIADRVPLEFLEWPDPPPSFLGRILNGLEICVGRVVRFLLPIVIIFLVYATVSIILANTGG